MKFKVNNIGDCSILNGDSLEVLKRLPAGSAHCCVTSPPYFGLRDYEVDGQIGNEPDPREYVERLVAVFAEVHRVLRDDGTLWLNIGDTYSNDGKWGGSSGGKHIAKLHGKTGIGRNKTRTGLPPKSLVGIPWRVAFALQDFGWCLRQEIIWHKPNPMPEAVKDRCTKAHEQIFLFTKNPRYYYGFGEMQEPAVCAGQSRGGSRNRYEQNSGNLNCKKYDTRNMRSVWTIKPDVSTGKKHFATFPEELARRCIVGGCPEGETVLDPFLGSGTTAIVALKNRRRAIGIELNPDYVKTATERFISVIEQLEERAIP